MDSALRKAIWETISTDPIIMAAPATVTIARGKVSPKALTKHVNVIISDEGFTDVIGLHGAVVDAQIEFRIVGWDQERRASLVADRIDLLMLRPYSIYVTEEDMTDRETKCIKEVSTGDWMARFARRRSIVDFEEGSLCREVLVRCSGAGNHRGE